MKSRYYIYTLLLLVVVALCGCYKDDTTDELIEQLQQEDVPQYDDETTTGGGVTDMGLILPATTRISELLSSSFEADDEISSTLKEATILFGSRDGYSEYSVDGVLIYVDVNGEEWYQIVVENSDELAAMPLGSYMLRSVVIKEDKECKSIGLICTLTEDGMTINTTIGDKYHGTGGSADPYIISMKSDFEDLIITEMSSGKTLSGIYFEQAASFEAYDLETAGGDSTSFAGHYNGGSLKGDISIKIIGVNKPLFYSLTSSATITNLTISDIFLYSNSTDGVGTLAIESVGATFSGVKLIGGNIVGVECVGGFTGKGYATFNECHSYVNVADVASGGEMFGGFMGKASYSKAVSFKDCSFRGEIKASGSKHVGGLIGYLYKDAITIDGCFISGSITGGFGTGGFIGKTSGVESITITNSSVGKSLKLGETGDENTVVQAVIITGHDTGVGGFIGEVYNGSSSSSTITVSDSSIERSSLSDYTYNVTNKLSGSQYMGGMIGYANRSNFKNCSFTNNDAKIGSSDLSLSHVGGVLGYGLDVSFSSCTFTNYGMVSSLGGYVGGIIGQIYIDCSFGSSFVGNTFVNNATHVSGHSSVGGCVGSIHSEGNSINHDVTFENNGSVSGTSYVGGLSGYLHTDGHFTVTAKQFDDARYTSGVIVGGLYTGGYYGKLDIDCSERSVTINFDSSCNMSVASTSYTDDDGASQDGSHTGGVIGSCVATGSHDSYIYVNAPQYMAVQGANNVGGLIGQLQCSLTDTDPNFTRLYITTYDNIRGGDASGTDSVDGSEDYTNLDGTISSSGDNAGGIIGRYCNSYGDAGIFLVLDKCYNVIDVNSQSGGSSMNLGGLIGHIENRAIIQNSCNVAAITSSAGWVGGLVGRIDNYETSGNDDSTDIAASRYTLIQGCFNSGEISDTNESAYRGGIMGKARSAIHLYDCYNSGTVESGGEGVAGLIGYVYGNGGGGIESTTPRDSRYDLLRCYNIGESGWGSIGGISGDPEYYEIGRTECYYLSTSASGDYYLTSHKIYSATSYSKSEMEALKFDDSSYWTYSSGYTPRISTIDYTSSYLSYPEIED